MAPDHGKLLRNAVEWAANEPRAATVEGRGVLDVTVWWQKESMTVHLVNLTNPMMMKRQLREFIPATEQHLAIGVPEGCKVKRVQLLVSGVAPGVRQAGGEVRLTVPSLLDQEVVALDF